VDEPGRAMFAFCSNEPLQSQNLESQPHTCSYSVIIKHLIITHLIIFDAGTVSVDEPGRAMFAFCSNEPL